MLALVWFLRDDCLFDVMSAWKMLKTSFCCECLTVHTRTVENSNIFAQAGQSRPSKSIRGSSLELTRVVAQTTSSCLEREPSRSGEEVLPKRENVKAPCSSFRALA